MPVIGVGLLHRRFQFALRDVLDLLVDGQDDVLARLGLLLDAAKPFAVGVHRDQHAPGLAAQFVVVLALDPAQPFVIHAHVAQHLRRQFALGIKALGFFLEINAAQIQRPDAVARFRRRPCAPPSRSPRSFALRQQFAGISPW